MLRRTIGVLPKLTFGRPNFLTAPFYSGAFGTGNYIKHSYPLVQKRQFLSNCLNSTSNFVKYSTVSKNLIPNRNYNYNSNIIFKQSRTKTLIKPIGFIEPKPLTNRLAYSTIAPRPKLAESSHFRGGSSQYDNGNKGIIPLTLSIGSFVICVGSFFALVLSPFMDIEWRTVGKMASVCVFSGCMGVVFLIFVA